MKNLGAKMKNLGVKMKNMIIVCVCLLSKSYRASVIRFRNSLRDDIHFATTFTSRRHRIVDLSIPVQSLTKLLT